MLLRLLHVVCEVPVEPQYEVLDDEGLFVARGDLWIRDSRTLHEYDGEHHLTRRRQRKDLARQRRIDNAGWTRRGYTCREVVEQASVNLRDADSTLGRAHRPELIRTWYALLGESLFTAKGTARLRRVWGLADEDAATGDVRRAADA